MIKVRHRGNFNNIEKFFKRMKNNSFMKYVEWCGEEGVKALSSATPTDTGATASSWVYTIDSNDESTTITWSNLSVTKNGIPIVILLKYGHATGTGGYVAGYDFIDPAIRDIFDGFVKKIWWEVTSS